MLAETLAPSSPASEPSRQPSAPKTRTKPRLVAYPFESAFDGGALGAKVAEVVTGHAARTGAFETLPKITQDEMLTKHPFRAAFETPLAQIARHARDAHDADVIVWGRVRAGRAKPVLDVKALDLRAREPGLVLAETYRCANIQLIPIHADEIVAGLLGRAAPGSASKVTRRGRAASGSASKITRRGRAASGSASKVTRRSRERFSPLRPRRVRALSGNLLANGTFSRDLSGWTPNFPRFVEVSRSRLLFDVDRSIAGGHGLAVLSDYVPVEPGAHYELSLRVRSHGPSVITWVKGYAEFPARSTGEREVDPRRPSTGSGRREPVERREVFRHQMRPASQEEPGPDGWIEVATHPFRPRHPKVKVTWMRVKLYGYHPPGKVEFDDVVLRKVAVEGESAESEDERMRRAWEGKDPGEALDKGPRR